MTVNDGGGGGDDDDDDPNSLKRFRAINFKASCS